MCMKHNEHGQIISKQAINIFQWFVTHNFQLQFLIVLVKK